MPKIVIIICLVVIVLFIIGNLWTYPFQQYFIFRSEKLGDDYQFKFDHPFEEVTLKTHGDGVINGLLFKSSLDVRKGVILYFHGNSDNCQRWGNIHTGFTNAGYDFFIMDYRGFGKSRGKQNQLNFYKDALYCYEYLSSSYDTTEIIIFGRSLGSAMATYVAAKAPAKLLILETPFYSMKDLFYCYYPILPRLFIFKFPFPSHRYLKRVKCPVTIFHGTDDWVVPYSSAAKLKNKIKDQDEFITLEGGSHSDLSTYKAYKETMKRVLD